MARGGRETDPRSDATPRKSSCLAIMDTPEGSTSLVSRVGVARTLGFVSETPGSARVDRDDVTDAATVEPHKTAAEIAEIARRLWEQVSIYLLVHMPKIVVLQHCFREILAGVCWRYKLGHGSSRNGSNM